MWTRPLARPRWIKRHSDNALRTVQEAVEELDMEDVWERNKPRRRAA